jgi:EmrB/QacA subfamily drug resistance transporter
VSLRRSPWLVVVALVPGMFLALADATVMTIAIPEIVQRLNSSVTAVSWILNGYNLTLTVLFMTAGRLADRFGHKGLFLLGLALFTAASLGCALSPSVAWIIGFRVLQAVGAAAIIPTSLTLMLDAYPAQRQGFAAGLFGAVSSLSAAAGPVLGGILIQAGGWQWIFYFNVPVGVAGFALVALLVRKRPHSAGVRMDWPGVVFVSAGLFCLTMALMEGNTWGWLVPPTLGLLVGAVVTLALFVWWELRVAAPLFDLRLLRRRAFAAAVTGMTTVDIALMGTAFMLVVYLVAPGNYTELKAGFAIAFMPAAGLLIAPIAGRLVDRVGPRALAVAGSLISAAGLVAVAYLPNNAPFWNVAWRTFIVGAGLGITVPALTAAGMTSLPAAAKGVGSGLLNTARQLGFLLGVAILVAVFTVSIDTAVNVSITRAQRVVDQQQLLSAQWRAYIIQALEQNRGINISANIGDVSRLIHPIEGVPTPPVGTGDAVALLSLRTSLEELFIGQVAKAFYWPFMTAMIAALLSVVPASMLQRRLRPEGTDGAALARGP